MQVVSRDACFSEIPQAETIAFGVKVNKNLFRIESMTVPWFLWSIDEIRTIHHGFDAYDESVSDIETTVCAAVEFDDSRSSG